MGLALILLSRLLVFYTFLLVLRIIIEMVASFSRRFRPPSWFASGAEVLFKLTDPPLLFLRRLIPNVRLGAVALDVSVLVLFFGLQLLSAGLVYAGNKLL